MPFEFAYSRGMEIILAIIVYVTTFFFNYAVANLALAAYDEKVSVRQKCIYAFFAGNVLQNSWTYLMYLVGGAVSFSKLAHLMIVCVNPLFAFTCLLIAVWTLKLPLRRGIRLIGHIFVYYSIVINLGRLLGVAIFVQSGPEYNYLLNAVQQVVVTGFMTLVLKVTGRVLKRHKFAIRLSETGFFNTRRDLLIFFGKTALVYALSVAVPMVTENEALAYLLLFCLFALFLWISLAMDFIRSFRQELDNKVIHIDALSKSIDEFRRLKHDFYNILQTYSGYLEMANLEGLRRYHASLLHTAVMTGQYMELSQRMEENPVLFSLLVSKAEYAERSGVDLTFSLPCDLSDLYIDSLDACRALACLLNNAVEAAAVSAKKKASISCEQKRNGAKLIIITNSAAEPVDVNRIMTSGVTSKENHAGIGLYNVRKMIERYENCSFQLTYYNLEVSAYLELAKPEFGAQSEDTIKRAAAKPRRKQQNAKGFHLAIRARDPSALRTGFKEGTAWHLSGRRLSRSRQ